MDKFQLGNYCCSESTIPLRVCKWINLHKLQGLSIGLGNDWDTVVVTLPDKRTKTWLGMELVAFSQGHPKGIISDTIWLHQRCHCWLLNGYFHSTASKDFRNFENLLWERSEKILAWPIQQIVELDHNRTTLKLGGGGGSSDWYNGLDKRLNIINFINITHPISYILPTLGTITNTNFIYWYGKLDN